MKITDLKWFKEDRVGHNDSGPLARANPTRVTYMAHGKGYVMIRHPGRRPFAIEEKLWRSFPLLDVDQQTEENK